MACRICRLCLKTVDDNNFEIIEHVTKEILQKLLLNLNLDISKEPIICDVCADKLQKSIDFKSICYYTDEETLLFKNLDGATMNSNEICLRNSNTVGIMDTARNQETCIFCKKYAGAGSYERSEFLKDSKETVFIINVLKIHIPELNLTLGEDTITCSSCFESIQDLYAFVLSCLSVEQKIEKYVEMGGRDDKGQINLNNVLKFTSSSAIKYEVTSTHCVVPQVEEVNYELIKSKYLKCKERKGVHRMESNCVEDVYGMDEINSDLMKNVRVKTEIADENLNGYENMVLNSILNVKSENIGIKSEDFKSFQDIPLTPDNVKVDDISAEMSSRESPPLVLPAQIDENPVNPDAPHRCNLCLFETKYKKSLNRHMLIHKNLSDIKVYKCDVCPYKSKHKHNLNEHTLVHKNPSEIIMFKCKLCSYEAKRKNNLTKHLILHKNPAEISMYKCTLCTYEAKFINDLRNHMICHKDISEVEMHKCQECTFETKHKGYLKKHMRIHQLEPQFQMYLCDVCPFKTRHRDSLNQHKLSHKDFSEVTMFMCQVCSFQTRYKKVLTGHMVMHKDRSEITMYKCELCPYETRRRNYLKMHALIHQSPADITMYRCDMCTYQTKRKIYLKQHMITHRKSTPHT